MIHSFHARRVGPFQVVVVFSQKREHSVTQDIYFSVEMLDLEALFEDGFA
jgi:hypothetical protein